MFEEAVAQIEKSQTTAGKGPDISAAAGFLLGMKDCENKLHFINELCKCLYSACFAGQKFLFPSDLRTGFTKGAARYLGDLTERAKLINLLEFLLGEKSTIAILLLPCIIRMFSSKLIVFIVKSIVGDQVRFSDMYVNSNEPTNTIEFRQNVHYVGVANVKNVLDTAKRCQNNSDEWKRVIDIWKSRFIVSEGSPPPPVDVMEWTQLQSRGGLIEINDAATDFFFGLATLVRDFGQLDGSVLTDKVFQKVCSSKPLLILWDAVIKGSMIKRESCKLLHALCCHFCVTWRNGAISRRMDAIQSKKKASQQGKGGLSFRGGL